MGEGQLLPLFPLPLVLFPGAALPLHIFEERYRLMVGEAARNHSEFGVLLVEDSQLATIGCTATVEQVVKEYDDGRFDVATEGRRRYRTLSLDQTKPYLQGSVEFFEDEQEPSPGPAQLERVVGLSRRIAESLRSEIPDLANATHPSFVITQSLPLDLKFKQQLLSMRAESERLEALSEHLEHVSIRLERARRAQQLAGTNGQAGRR